ncbi:asparagine synthase C-terminal domain-containing protein [Candidatus Woesearchaeota archaeon]|nr:asparagine synthase C-terminal domain-containing protein [Candidatus Woesearchaeota archaeon]
MKELFPDGTGNIVEEATWQQLMHTLKSDESIIDKTNATLKIKEALIGSVKSRASHGCGVLFSGGVDSATIAMILNQLGVCFKCFTVGTQDSKDLLFAEKIAEEYGFENVVKIFNEDKVIQLFKDVIKLLNRTDTVSVGVGSVMLGGLKLAKKNNCSCVFTGLGAEEIFGGYQRHIEAADLNRECWRGLLDVFWERDLKRDCTIAKHVGIGVATPFLDSEVIKAAMMIPAKFKYKEGYKKYVLREAAEELGLKHEYAFRRKLAGQYGSGFDKVLERAAKQKGFEKKRDYLKSLS